MLSTRNRQKRSRQPLGTAPLGRPGARNVSGNGVGSPVAGAATARAIYAVAHPLANRQENDRLYAYERSVKDAFDAIVPTLKQISAVQHEADFQIQAQRLAKAHLGFDLPAVLLDDAWVDQLDMRSLFAWCVFETYHRFCDDVFTRDPLADNDDSRFQAFLEDCGFHLLDISPCADGRLAHVIRYVLRLPYRAVRRRSFAGAMFDIEDSLEKWTRTELVRYREGKPNTADAPTRYLKAVVYHHSSVDPEHEGCAAHGSDTMKAAQGGVDRLLGFQQAVQNTHCCGASIDCLLIGMDTDTDAIRVHMPDRNGSIDLGNYVDSLEVFDATAHLSASQAEQWVNDHIAQKGGANLPAGMARFIAYLLINNISQVDYVRNYYNGHYDDIGHAERFIGAGIGFEEVQLRNLTFFAYLNTVEEAARDLDVGIMIFTGLNVSHGLPVPIVVRYDYHGHVPGERERAEEHCQRVSNALHDRYRDLSERGLLHTLQVVRDINAAARIEILDCSVKTQASAEAH
ncbi:MAG: carboxysome shell carbonic anhydrase [Gammaproteobacteria bacterium]|nr:carboxysome shell carbonic anhydrase [Gammaproteobacteria bacterium]NNJ96083.1 carboxysome shell carbonic anhydrase [Gammaproteobacteria bacterium]